MAKKLVFIGLLLLPLLAQAQKKVKSSPINEVVIVRMNADNWIFPEKKVEFLEYKERPSMKILPDAGPVVLKGLTFTDGTIEFDHEPLDPRFASVYFRWKDKGENECFYFRTARAGQPTAVDAVQYSPHVAGVNLWDLMGHYQTNATFQKGNWNHVKLVVSGLQMQVYVNAESRPTLEIPRLEGNVMQGTLAFDGEAIISNLVIKPNQTEGLSPTRGVDPTDHDPRYLRNWQVSTPLPIPKGIDFSYDLTPKDGTTWQSIETERRGLVNLTRKFGKSETRRIVWLKVRIKSDIAHKRKINLGFSDEVWVVLNGGLLYMDKNYYNQPIMKEPDGRISLENTHFVLPLKAGENELLIGVGNDFFGWGIVARLDDLKGIEILK